MLGVLSATDVAAASPERADILNQLRRHRSMWMETPVSEPECLGSPAKLRHLVIATRSPGCSGQRRIFPG